MMNKQEGFAWIRFATMVSVLAYLFWKLFLIDSPLEIAAWKQVQDNVSNVFYACMFAMVVVEFWLGKGVFRDERDRAISAYAFRSALIALTLIIFFSAAIMGVFSSFAADLLTTYPAAWFQHYLMACLALAWAIESWVCVLLYWRDRR